MNDVLDGKNVYEANLERKKIINKLIAYLQRNPEANYNHDHEKIKTEEVEKDEDTIAYHELIASKKTDK